MGARHTLQLPFVSVLLCRCWDPGTCVPGKSHQQARHTSPVLSSVETVVDYVVVKLMIAGVISA
jgi:hypothetical protein